MRCPYSQRVPEALVKRSIKLGDERLRLLQPRESADLPDAGEIEWAPIAPYWSVLWRSGVALARELGCTPLRGLHVVELGCGLAVPSIAAARAGATVLATDADPAALGLVARNARLNGVEVGTARVEWTQPDQLLTRAPFDLVLAADALYEDAAVEPLLRLLPQLAPEAWLACPDRPAATAFLARARRRWAVETRVRDVIGVHRVRLDRPPRTTGSPGLEAFAP